MSGANGRLQGLAITARVAVAIFGGYAATAGLVAASAVGMAAAGMARSEAAMASFLVGIVTYLGLLIWAFAERRLALVAIVLAALAAAGFAVGTGG